MKNALVTGQKRIEDSNVFPAAAEISKQPQSVNLNINVMQRIYMQANAMTLSITHKLHTPEPPRPEPPRPEPPTPRPEEDPPKPPERPPKPIDDPPKPPGYPPKPIDDPPVRPEKPPKPNWVSIFRGIKRVSFSLSEQGRVVRCWSRAFIVNCSRAEYFFAGLTHIRFSDGTGQASVITYKRSGRMAGQLHVNYL